MLENIRNICNSWDLTISAFQNLILLTNKVYTLQDTFENLVLVQIGTEGDKQILISHNSAAPL